MARVLVLGGTAEAATLAKALAGHKGCEVVLSLAGRTADPQPVPVETRIGGFGGADGLGSYLAAERIDALVDATHPFARQISEHAAQACTNTGTPRLVLLRPPWEPVARDDWHHVASENGAAECLPASARAFLALGRQRLAPFATRADVWFLVRTVDPPDEPLLPGPHLTVTGRGPFEVDGERKLLETHRVSHLVARNSGGDGSYAKLEAARALALPVIMIDRPPPPAAGPVVPDVPSVLEWLGALMP